LVVFEGLETSEGRTACENFVAEARLVLLEVVILVDLVVRLL
jgi:hypothetical protein